MGKLGAAFYDFLMWLGARRLGPLRRTVVGEAKGRVLELGVGTGLNVPFYPAAARVVGAEPDLAMLGRARRRAAAGPPRSYLVAAVGEALPFLDGSFDEVVVTLVFCSVRSTQQTLAEIRRVLKPAGSLRFLEHVRSDRAGWARFQDAVTPLWRTVANG